MLTAYLDECGQEKQEVVWVAGFIGNDEHWKKLAAEWPKAFAGVQRKSLHMASLKFEYESERNLLTKLGAIPYDCGLRRIAGSVDVRDYVDLTKGTVAEVHAHGYVMAMVPLIEAIEYLVPTRESYKLVFEEQPALGFYRDQILKMISYTMTHPPPDRAHIKRAKLTGWETLVKGQSCLCEPADYLCYHLAHKNEDAASVRTLWSSPIMKGDSIWKSHLSRERARTYFEDTIPPDKLEPSGLAAWKKRLRRGELDPWSAVLERAENEYTHSKRDPKD